MTTAINDRHGMDATNGPTRAFPRKVGRHSIEVTLLVGPGGDQLYGTDTAYGRLWKPSKAELVKAIRFIYGQRRVEIVDSWLAEG